MKEIEDIKTIDDILDAEREMIPLAEKKYGDAFRNAAGFNNLLNNFLKGVKSDAWVFMVFLSQIKKHHTLTLFSAVRLHHIQAVLNLRQVLEAGVNAAYGLANPNKDDFIVQQKDGTLDTSDTLDMKRRKWIEDNYKESSDFIKNMKNSINKSCAHSNMIYAFSNFSIADYKFHTSFFDAGEEHRVKTDLWMIGNIALGLVDLFYGINKEVDRLTFVDEFVKQLKNLEKGNLALKTEMEQHPRFQRLKEKRNDEK